MRQRRNVRGEEQRSDGRKVVYIEQTLRDARIRQQTTSDEMRSPNLTGTNLSPAVASHLLDAYISNCVYGLYLGNVKKVDAGQ